MQTESAVSAPLWRRVLAAIYDLLPVAGLLMIATAIALLVARMLVPVDRVDLVLRSGWPQFALQAWLGLLTLAYYVLSWRRGGQTIGMRAWRVAVRPDRGTLDLPAALLRFVVGCVGVLAFGLGWLWCLRDRHGRAWHDLAAGTRVVLIEKR